MENLALHCINILEFLSQQLLIKEDHGVLDDDYKHQHSSLYQEVEILGVKIDQYIEDGQTDTHSVEERVDKLYRKSQIFATVNEDFQYRIPSDKVLVISDGMVDLYDWIKSIGSMQECLEVASHEGYTHVVDILLATGKVNPSLKDNYCLRWSSINRHELTVHKLLEDTRVDSKVVLKHPRTYTLSKSQFYDFYQLMLPHRHYDDDDMDMYELVESITLNSEKAVSFFKDLGNIFKDGDRIMLSGSPSLTECQLFWSEAEQKLIEAGNVEDLQILVPERWTIYGTHYPEWYGRPYSLKHDPYNFLNIPGRVIREAYEFAEIYGDRILYIDGKELVDFEDTIKNINEGVYTDDTLFVVDITDDKIMLMYD